MSINAIMARGPQNPAELSKLSAYVDLREQVRRLDRIAGPVCDAVLIAGALAGALAGLTLVAVAGIAVWVIVGIRQGDLAATAAAQRMLCENPDRLEQAMRMNVTGAKFRRSIATTLYVTCIAMSLVFAVLATRAPWWFVAVAVAQAAWTLSKRIRDRTRIPAVRQAISSAVASHGWARQWADEQSTLELQAANFLADAPR